MNKDEAQKLLESAKWTFARSMPWVPHYYTQIQEWEVQVAFREVARFITSDGAPMVWERKPPKAYLDLGEWRYWHMDPSPEVTILINRELIAKSKAKPWAAGEPA